MNTKIYLLLILAFCGLTFTACNDDDGPKINDELKTAFSSMYPNATGVDWDKKGNYYVAEFRLDGKEKDAWFDGSGKWLLTETGLRFEELPEPVKTTFTASEYATWRIDEVDMVERPEMEIVYVIDVEKNNQEYDLYYSPDGTFIKAILDTGNNGSSYIPPTLLASITEYINLNYPTAKIVDVEYERGVYEVEINDGGKHKDVIFNETGNWLYTKMDIRTSEVPQNVITALENSEYKDYTIDEVDYYQSPNGDYYIFELEQGGREVHVKVTTAGQVEPVIA